MVTFYTKSSELLNLFQMGEIWAAPVARYSWGQFLDTGLPVAWVEPDEGTLGFFSTLSLVKNAKNVDEAYAYIDFLLSKGVQEAEAVDLVDSPVNVNVSVPEDKAEFLTIGAEQANALIFYDLDTIVRNRDAWLEKWNIRIAQ